MPLVPSLYPWSWGMVPSCSLLSPLCRFTTNVEVRDLSARSPSLLELPLSRFNHLSIQSHELPISELCRRREAPRCVPCPPICRLWLLSLLCSSWPSHCPHPVLLRILSHHILYRRKRLRPTRFQSDVFHPLGSSLYPLVFPLVLSRWVVRSFTSATNERLGGTSALLLFSTLQTSRLKERTRCKKHNCYIAFFLFSKRCDLELRTGYFLIPTCNVLQRQNDPRAVPSPRTYLPTHLTKSLPTVPTS